MKKRKALTLIEVLIALSILAIVMGILFPFFIRIFKAYNNTAIKSELQNEAENAIRIISKIAMEAKKVNSLDGANIDNSSGVYKIDGSSHKTLELLSGSDEINKFQLEEGLLYKIPPINEKVQIANYVTYLEIVPLDETTFQQSRGIKMVLHMKKKEVEYKVSNILFFRNKT
ncbi:prepilin-type N-terminal cleavage/methylation domain-containing protein [Clostridium punense]|uniref:Prepilin-type N-terminal cleavage/methylation domain-containing protein n=1 Tax=Clostridium punense TaxID=1054297 RepID=A0ABS4JYV9_9CLOT|nr:MULTISPECIES: prepilin-type N-terminal cleavage/methylation domain-containing protein [Clostridium]EQB87473.1 hypothetical protein M918_08750 [Clostridium sp. BL8]MBP2020718.1 prepilin-type N-terminal cleavage/methylation domain-containing protein [Clostridium punense]